MYFSVLIAALCIALTSLVGVVFFANTKKLLGTQKYVVPLAVGVFLSLILFELIPETLALSPQLGGVAVGFGFISFYVLANYLHHKYHHLETEECGQKGAAALLLIGGGIHSVADGIILGGAFLVNPTVGIATAIGLALHQIPQGIVQFGVLIRSGYTRKQAAAYNLFSASSIFIGVFVITIIADYAANYVWVITGVAAGNLLYLAASDLLPRIHGNLKDYGSIWHSTASITIGFVLMTGLLSWTHEKNVPAKTVSPQNSPAIVMPDIPFKPAPQDTTENGSFENELLVLATDPNFSALADSYTENCDTSGSHYTFNNPHSLSFKDFIAAIVPARINADGSTVLIVPCAVYIDQTMELLVLDTDSSYQPIATLMNASYEAQTDRFYSYTKGARLGECGDSTEYSLQGLTLTLEKRATDFDCEQ